MDRARGRLCVCSSYWCVRRKNGLVVTASAAEEMTAATTMVWYGMVWYGMVWYGRCLWRIAGGRSVQVVFRIETASWFAEVATDVLDSTILHRHMTSCSRHWVVRSCSRHWVVRICATCSARPWPTTYGAPAQTSTIPYHTS